MVSHQILLKGSKLNINADNEVHDGGLIFERKKEKGVYATIYAD